jgi:hypothetical protein
MSCYIFEGLPQRRIDHRCARPASNSPGVVPITSGTPWVPSAGCARRPPKGMLGSLLRQPELLGCVVVVCGAGGVAKPTSCARRLRSARLGVGLLYGCCVGSSGAGALKKRPLGPRKRERNGNPRLPIHASSGDWGMLPREPPLRRPGAFGSSPSGRGLGT